MAWQFFHLLSSLVLLPVLTATFILSKSIKRRLPTLINICFVWFLSGHIYSLLYYGGNNKPTPRLCKIQAALMTGVHPMWFTALLMLVVHVTLILKKPGFLRRVQVFWMIIAPYLMFLLWALVAVYGLSTCSKKGNGYNECLQQAFNKKRQFVCELHSYKDNDAGSDITQAMSIFTLIIGILIIGVESHLAVDLHGFYKGLSFSHHIDICLLVRVVFFSVYISVLGAIMEVARLFNHKSLVPDMYTATLGLVVFLIFGTHPDVVHAWIGCLLCRRRSKRQQTGKADISLPLPNNYRKGSSNSYIEPKRRRSSSVPFVDNRKALRASAPPLWEIHKVSAAHALGRPRSLQATQVRE